MLLENVVLEEVMLKDVLVEEVMLEYVLVEELILEDVLVGTTANIVIVVVVVAVLRRCTGRKGALIGDSYGIRETGSRVGASTILATARLPNMPRHAGKPQRS